MGTSFNQKGFSCARSVLAIIIAAATFGCSGRDYTQSQFAPLKSLDLTTAPSPSPSPSASPIAPWVGIIDYGIAHKQLRIQAATTDSAGNIYTAGFTDANPPGGAPAPGYAYIAKFNSVGTQQWFRLLGTSSASVSAMGIAADATGAVYVGGSTTGPIVSGNTQTGVTDAFLAKYDTNGSLIFANQFGIATSGGILHHAIGTAVVADASGAYLAGYTDGSLDGVTHPPYPSTSTFVKKFSPTGSPGWIKEFSPSNSGLAIQAFAAAINSSGVYIGGQTTTQFGGGLSGSIDSFIINLNPSTGATTWIKQFGIPGDNVVSLTSLVADSNYIYATGAGVPGFDYNGIFAAQFSASSGAQTFTKSIFPGAIDIRAASITLDSTGIYVTGKTTVSIGTGSAAIKGLSDAFVTKFDLNASHPSPLWTYDLGVLSHNTYGAAVVPSLSGGVVLAGSTDGVLPETGIAALFGYVDGYLAKLSASGALQ